MEFKSIPNFDNYIIYQDGRVYNQKGKRWLKGSINSQNGYPYVQMTNNQGERKKKYIHRLIAEAFIPNPDNLPFINHKDENRTNYSIENLEWCSIQYNTLYNGAHNKTTQKIIGENNGLARRVVMCNATTKSPIKYFGCIKDASIYLGKDTKGISNISHAVLDRESHKAYGYYWQFTTDEEYQAHKDD